MIMQSIELCRAADDFAQIPESCGLCIRHSLMFSPCTLLHWRDHDYIRIHHSSKEPASFT
jgi:hypothetical protein